jgi:hypothetical protein
MLRFGTQSIDIGKLTEDETADLFIAAAKSLREERLLESFDLILTTKQKEELGETWFNIDSGPR